MNRFYETKLIADLYVKYRPSYNEEVSSPILRFANRNKLKPPFDHVVDVGCGSGQVSKLFAQYARKVTGIDPSENQIKKAAAVANTLPNISFKVGFAEKMPFADKSIDIILSAAAIHFTEIREFLKECDRVLKPNGIISVWDYVFPTIVKIGSGYIQDIDGKLSDTKNLTNSLFSLILNSPAYEMSKAKYKPLFDMIPSEIKEYQSIIVKEKRSLDGIYGYIQSTGLYQKLMEAEMDKLKSAGKSVNDENMKELDPGLKYINDLKDIWGISEEDNSLVEVEIDWEFSMVLASKSLFI